MNETVHKELTEDEKYITVREFNLERELEEYKKAFPTLTLEEKAIKLGVTIEYLEKHMLKFDVNH